MHRELQGTRIRRGSGAAAPPQTVIIINVFSLNYVMCVEGGGTEGEKTTKGEMSGEMGDEGGRDEPDGCGSESEGVGRGAERGDSQTQERQEDSQKRPEHAALLVPTK